MHRSNFGSPVAPAHQKRPHLHEPRRTRALAVPKGIASAWLISRAVKPYKAARTRARRCSLGRRDSAVLTRSVSSVTVAASSGIGREPVGPRRSGLVGRRAGHPSSESVHRQVASDRQHPGGHGAAASIVGAGSAPGSDQRFLGDFLGLVRIAHDGPGQPVGAALIAAHKRGRRTRIALASRRRAPPEGLSSDQERGEVALWVMGASGSSIPDREYRYSLTINLSPPLRKGV